MKDTLLYCLWIALATATGALAMKLTIYFYVDVLKFTQLQAGWWALATFFAFIIAPLLVYRFVKRSQ